MGRDIPLKKVVNNDEKKTQEVPEEEKVSPYDIILGNVELNYEKIPEFIQILKKYQMECEKEARYMDNTITFSCRS